MYKISWFPLAGLLEGRENYLFLSFCLIIVLFTFDLEKLNLKLINLKKLDNLFLLSLFLIASYSTIFYNTNEIIKIQNAINLVSTIFMILLFGIILPKFIYNTGYFLKLVNIISTFGFLTALFGFFLYFSGYKPLATAEYLISFIRHPNGVSIILSLTSLATIYYYFAKLDELTLFKKYFYFISFILQFFAELLTQSRTGILALVIALSVFFSFYYRKKIIILFPIAVISVKIFILDYILKKGSASFISRARLWLVAIDLLEKSRQTFIWGYGYTEGNKLFQKNAFYFTEIVEHPHNAYISLTLMFGIIFLAVFILYILFLLIRNFYIEFKHKEKKIQLFINFITSTMLLILLQGIFESPMVLYWYFLMPIFIMFLGLNHLMNNKNYQFDNFLKSNSNLI